MPIRIGDTVQYIRFMGDDARQNPEDWGRHQPDGEPVVGDYGVVDQITGDTATVAWRFGNTTEMLLEHLYKHPVRKMSHRYVVLFENGTGGEDRSYAVWTEGGPLKAVYVATRALLSDMPDLHPWAIEVDDQGPEASRGPADLIVYHEVA